MILDFCDDDGPDARPGIGRAKSERILQWQQFIADTIDVAREGDTVEDRAKLKPVCVTGELAVRERRKEIHGLASGTESKGSIAARAGIELAFVEGYVSVPKDRGPVGDA